MSKKTKEQIFKEAFYYWLGYFGLDANKIPLSKDNRGDAGAVTFFYIDNTYHVKYNTKKLSHKSIPYIYGNVIHEIAHILQDLPEDNDEDTIYSEMCAEIFALTMMRKQYPDLIESYIEEHRRLINNPKWKKQHELHEKAFRKIKEFN